jgi:tyrosyl-tRNA synthetase
VALRHAATPHAREAQKLVAYTVTALVHGEDAAAAAIAATGALFGQGDLDALDADTLEAALRELPSTTTPHTTTVVQALVDTALSPSLSAARRSVAEGGVYVNNVKITDDTSTFEEYILHSRMAVLRRGKKTLAGVFVE